MGNCLSARPRPDGPENVPSQTVASPHHGERENDEKSPSTMMSGDVLSESAVRDPLYVVPMSFSNIAGAAVHFHSAELWNARAGYERTGTHDPGYVTDPAEPLAAKFFQVTWPTACCDGSHSAPFH